MNLNKRILFYIPDYHCSFFLRDELRKLGWKADIYVPPLYSNQILFSLDVVSFIYRGSNRFIKLVQNYIYFFYCLISYKYIFFYGPPFEFFHLLPKIIEKKMSEGYSLGLELAKYFGKKIIFIQSGFCDITYKNDIYNFSQGKKCSHCWKENTVHCDDSFRLSFINRIKRYSDLNIGTGIKVNDIIPLKHIKYKSLDLSLWNPNIIVPEEYRIRKNGKLLIMHSLSDSKDVRKNQKGSYYVQKAIDRLIKEDYPIYFYHANKIQSKFMRYYQVQADIIVEQIISGWHGSTGVETMALGKPVVCFLHSVHKKQFFEFFPEYDSLPIIEAGTENIYDVLKYLIESKNYREQKGKESREFAEKHFDKEKNAKDFEKIILDL